jgi:hypothetical protein
MLLWHYLIKYLLWIMAKTIDKSDFYLRGSLCSIRDFDCEAKKQTPFLR